jgi:hypothetical protein
VPEGVDRDEDLALAGVLGREAEIRDDELPLDVRDVTG